ncbi:low temperature requirement protein A [Conyzicola nivalis]|nr:low temperature requirement protein A [Conyzicola nivalis]
MSRNILREKRAGNSDRVTFVELFFDLVFVLAITQLSALLSNEPNGWGFAQTVLICLAVWWLWVYTSWATNWLDPDTRPVLWLLLLLMAVALVLSSSIPGAFGSKGLIFAGAYVLYQLIRTVFVIVASARHRAVVADGQKRILIWLAVSAPFWLVGALQEERLRLLLWAIALAIDYLGPATLFWLPKRGRSSWEAWQIRGAHFAERAALFIIIVLGESILVTGRSLTGDELTPESALAFTSAFASSVALWLLYFAHGERGGTSFIKAKESTGPVARVSYTYLHVVLVIGIVITTHGHEVTSHHPLEEASLSTLAFAAVGPAIYLVGNIAFKASVGIRPRLLPGHIAGTFAYLVLYVLVAAGALHLTALALSWVATGILIAVVTVDERLWRRRQVPTTSPSEQLAL